MARIKPEDTPDSVGAEADYNQDGAPDDQVTVTADTEGEGVTVSATADVDDTAGQADGFKNWVVHQACAGTGCGDCEGRGLVPPG